MWSGLCIVIVHSIDFAFSEKRWRLVQFRKWPITFVIHYILLALGLIYEAYPYSIFLKLNVRLQFQINDKEMVAFNLLLLCLLASLLMSSLDINSF